MLSEVEKVLLRLLGDKIRQNKESAIGILLEAVKTTDQSTSLVFAGALMMGEALCHTMLWKACKTVDEYVLIMNGDGCPGYHKELMELLGWQ